MSVPVTVPMMGQTMGQMSMQMSVPDERAGEVASWERQAKAPAGEPAEGTS